MLDPLDVLLIANAKRRRIWIEAVILGPAFGVLVYALLATLGMESTDPLASVAICIVFAIGFALAYIRLAVRDTQKPGPPEPPKPPFGVDF